MQVLKILLKIKLISKIDVFRITYLKEQCFEIFYLCLVAKKVQNLNVSKFNDYVVSEVQYSTVYSLVA